MSSYYVELDNDLGDEIEAFGRVKGKRELPAFLTARGPKKKRRKAAVVHNPATDAEAIELITSLDHFVWTTHKVTGRYTTMPYSLRARVGNRNHVINLPGRRGATLTWLRDRVDELEKKA